jgi:hypothetical protein
MYLPHNDDIGALRDSYKSRKPALRGDGAIGKDYPAKKKDGVGPLKQVRDLAE